MMSIKQWLMLWLIFIGYLFLGAFVFYSIERRYEEYRRVDDNPEKLNIEDLLNTYYTWTNNRAHQQLLLRLKKYCNVTIANRASYTNNIVEVEEEFQWTFYNSFFFALTTLSTIGYGNLHPTSCLGRMLVIIYSLVGIPLNGIVLTQLGEFFASTFLKVHQRYKRKRFETRFVMLVDIAMYLIPGILLFIFLPSGIFVFFEGWTFEESIYFAFVTLTTIGYGDFVAGQTTKDKWYGIYKVLIIFWIMFGLGYLVMILGFISRAMRCKKMAQLERKLAQNLKHTHSKILNEFTRDVTYIRRMLNELYLLKFKPVYQDEKPPCDPLMHRRSQSAPNFSKWPILEKISKPVTYSSSEDEEETRMQFEKLRMRRRKALSENLYKHSALRVHSDTDLTKIDKNATFNNAGYVECNELMARVMDAYETTYSGVQSVTYSNFTDNENEQIANRKVSQFEKELKGIDEFSNKKIISNEVEENDEKLFKDEKFRTFSEQWTWPGSENITNNFGSIKNKTRLNSITQENVDKRRSLQLPGVESLRRMSVAALNFLSPSKHGSKMNTSKEDETDDVEMAKTKELRNRKSGKILCPRKLSKKRYSLCDPEYEDMCEYINNFTETRMKETNIFTALKNQIGYLDKVTNVNPVLGQTSLSDFLLIVNSLSPNVSEQKADKSIKTLSPLFTLFQDQVERKSATDTPLSCNNRRYSLATPQKQTLNVSRNKSFSSNARRVSSMKFVRERTQSISAAAIPQIRRIRSESISSQQADVDYSAVSQVNPPSRQIRRFLVKPVITNLPMPEIVISQPDGSSTLKKISTRNFLEDVRLVNQRQRKKEG